jgi:uncharacterized protein YbaP (TraB family)
MHTSFDGHQGILDRFMHILETENIQAYFGETDMSEMAARQTMPEMGIPALRDQMSPKRFDKFRKKLRQFTGLDLLQFDRMPPMFASALIASQLVRSDGQSMDQALWSRASTLGIPTHGLESFDEQMKIFHAIPYDFQLIQLKQMLANLSRARRSLKKMIDQYRQEAIHKLHSQGRKTLGPIRKLILEDRNLRMVNRMIDHMKNSEGAILFTFGAAHLAGEHGILHGLKSRGCQLKPL